MSSIVIMIIASLLVAGGFLAAFFWAVRSGQFDDTYTPSVRMLLDNSGPAEEKTHKRKSTEQN